MDSRDLKVFETVARHSTVHGAARELNTVQSNVTMRIQQIEAELGVSLFERHSKGVRLTQAGQRLLPHALEVHAAIESAKRAVIEDGVPKGPLAIGTLQSTFTIHLSTMLPLYLAAFPQVDIALHTATTPILVDQVLRGNLDGAFIYGPFEHPELVSELFFEDVLVILSAPAITDLSAMSLTNTRMIVLKSGWNHKRLETILAKRGLNHLRVLELGTLEAVLDCVSAGLGVTLMPKGVIDSVPHKQGIREHKVSGAMEKAQTLFIRRRVGFVSSALSTFLNHARSAMDRNDQSKICTDLYRGKTARRGLPLARR